MCLDVMVYEYVEIEIWNLNHLAHMSGYQTEIAQQCQCRDAAHQGCCAGDHIMSAVQIKR